MSNDLKLCLMCYLINVLILILVFVLLTFSIKKKQSLRSNNKRIAIAEKGVPSYNIVIVHDKGNDELPKKKLKGLAAILKHSLSLLTVEEITSKEKVE